MTNPLHCAFVALLLLLSVAGPARAQSSEAPTGAEQNATEAPATPSLASSLTVSFANTDFFYAGEDTVTPYDFTESPVALTLSWQQGALAISYGRREADSTAAQPLLRTVGANLRFGGDVYLFRNLFQAPLALFIPIRLSANYRYASVNEETDDAATPPLHLVGGGLGLGAGARLALPPSGPPLALEASYTVTPGARDNFGKGLDAEDFEQPPGELKMRRATDLDFELQLKRLFGNAVGLTAGYTLRTVARSQEKPASFADVVDAVIYGGEFVQITDAHVFRVGINW